jgi:hypothetical protein
MFIYAIIGMSSFGNLKITGGVLDEDVVNFKTFASSFVMNIVILLVFNVWSQGVIVRFIDIGGIVDQHCFKLSFHNSTF